jgi:uncharacterized protein
MNHFLDQPPTPEVPTAPLSPEELSELAGLLASDATPDECMNISKLDGFLTALAIGPRLPHPDLWLPVIWGRKSALRFDYDEALVCGSSIARLMNDISRGFKESPPQLTPIIEVVEEGEVIRTVEDWASGFMEGLLLNAADWEQIFADQAEGLTLLPMMTLGTELGLEALKTRKTRTLSTNRWRSCFTQQCCISTHIGGHIRQSITAGGQFRRIARSP